MAPKGQARTSRSLVPELQAEQTCARPAAETPVFSDQHTSQTLSAQEEAHTPRLNDLC